jgi:hypothetical protein
MVGRQPARPVAHGHPADGAGEEVGGPEARCQASGLDPLRLGISEVDARGIGRGQARVGERQGCLRENEHSEGGQKHPRVE